MKAIILAAGKSTRTYPLTLTQPKPLLKIANKALLEHTLERLAGIVDEIVIIVGYKKEMIKDYFGDKYIGIKIRYVEQKEQLGTGHALMMAKNFAKGKFFVFMGDDIYPVQAIKDCLKFEYAVVCQKVDMPENFGVFVVEKNLVADLVEKPKVFVSNLANTGMYLLDEKIFEILQRISRTERNEYELTDGIRELAKKCSVRCIATKEWIPICYPWDLIMADAVIRGKKNLIGRNSAVNGKVVNSSIGDNCRIKGKVKNSIIFDNSVVEGAVEDSVIGKGVYFKGTVKSARNFAKNVNGKSVKVERFGTAIGDNVKAVDVDVVNGAMVWPDKILHGKKVSEDMADYEK